MGEKFKFPIGDFISMGDKKWEGDNNLSLIGVFPGVIGNYYISVLMYYNSIAYYNMSSSNMMSNDPVPKGAS